MKAYHGTAGLQFDDPITGNSASGALITIRVNSTQALADIYDLDEVAIANPLTANALGNYAFKTTDNIYDIIISEGTAIEQKLVKVEVFDIPASLDLINDLSQAYEFPTVAAYKAFAAAFPVGKVIHLLDRGTEFTIISGTGTADGFSIIQSDQVSQSASLVLFDGISEIAFGVVGNGTINDTLAVQACLDSIVKVMHEAVNHRIESTLTVTNGMYGRNENTLFTFYGASLARLISKELPGNMSNFSVDGANVTACPTGIYIEADYEPIREEHSNLTVTNITDAANPTYGILLARFSDDLAIRGNFFFDKCVVKGITGSSVAKGIIVSFNNESQANMTIRSCDVQDVTPATDGDAIHIVTGAHDDPAADEYQALIENCYVKSTLPMKRGFKVQWHNAKVNNNTVIGDNILIGYDTYSYGCTFDGNTYTSNDTAGEAYNCFDAFGTVISNTNIRTTSNAQAMRFSGSSSIKLSNVNIEYQGTAAGDTLGIVQVQDATEVNAVNLTINAANSAGCGILQSGSGSVSISNSKISGMKFGHRCNFGTGSFRMTGQTVISNVEYGAQVFGDLGFTYDIADSYISASNIGLYGLSSGNKAKTNARNTEILVGSSGVLGTDEDTVVDCIIKNTGVQAGTGIISGIAGRVSNNTVENFTTGLQYNFATNTIINSNTFITCATPIVKTGSVDFVFYENNNR